jgi:hypothetical protein
MPDYTLLKDNVLSNRFGSCCAVMIQVVNGDGSGRQGTNLTILSQRFGPRPALEVMKRCLPCLFFMLPFLALSSLTSAQCGYPAAIAAARGYCINSPIWIHSTHGLQSIVWYKDGQPVKTATASQSLDPNGTIAVAWTADGGSETDRIEPVGLYIDEGNNLYVSDFWIPHVKKYPPGGGVGVVVAGGNSWGSSPSQLQSPTSVFVDRQGNLYVFDTGNGRVQKFAPGDTTATTVAMLPGGRTASAMGLYVDCA